MNKVSDNWLPVGYPEDTDRFGMKDKKAVAKWQSVTGVKTCIMEYGFPRGGGGGGGGGGTHVYWVVRGTCHFDNPLFQTPIAALKIPNFQ